MSIMKSVLLPLLIFVAGTPLLSQTPAKPATPEKPVQDEAALRLLERYDALLYNARNAGLKDLEFSTKLPIGVKVVVRWKDPDRTAADVTVPEDAPPERKKQLELMLESVRAQASSFAPAMVPLFTGESEAAKHAANTVTLAGEGKVKVVALDAKSKAQFKEQLITFDERGLAKHVKVVAPNGTIQEIEPKFFEKNGKFLLSEVKTIFAPTTTKTITFEYADAGAFTFIRKMTTSGATEGEETSSSVLEFTDVKANSGLDDALFPAAEKPKQG
jgi:hypothetical protein